MIFLPKLKGYDYVGAIVGYLFLQTAPQNIKYIEELFFMTMFGRISIIQFLRNYTCPPEVRERQLLVVDVYHRPQVSRRLGDEYRGGGGKRGELLRKGGRRGK